MKEGEDLQEVWRISRRSIGNLGATQNVLGTDVDDQLVVLKKEYDILENKYRELAEKMAGNICGYCWRKMEEHEDSKKTS